MVRATRYLGLLCLLVVVQPSLAPGAEADKAAEAFNALYGQDLKRAKATRDTSDDLELATRLLAAAKDATRQPEFLTVLCEKAFDLTGGYPDGHATAMKAMETLATAVPAKVTWCTEQVVALLQKQFTAARGDDRAKAGEELIEALLALADLKADGGAPTEAAGLCRRAEKAARAVKSDRLAEIDERQKALASSLRAAREAANLKTLLERSPQNAAAREKLVRLYLVDMDNPAEAARYVEGVADESLRKYVPAAAKGAEAAPELACAELGDWYRGLAEKAPSGAKPAMYARARGYYERFLELHMAEDLRRMAASLALKKVEAALEKLGPAAPSKFAKGKWIDLLPLVDPAKDAVKGDWKRQADALAILSPTKEGRIIIPVVPEGSYELQAKFVRTSGDDSVAVILPVGSARVTLNLSEARGRESGLCRINGKGANDNETTVRPGTLVNGREYALHITVVAKGDQAQIAVRLDGKPYIDWRGPQSALSLSSWWALPKSGCLGLGAWETTVVFRTVRLKMLSGEARLLRPKGK